MRLLFCRMLVVPVFFATSCYNDNYQVAPREGAADKKIKTKSLDNDGSEPLSGGKQIPKETSEDSIAEPEEELGEDSSCLKSGYEVATLVGNGVTFYFPEQIRDSSCKHPVISWGNGSGQSGGNRYPAMFKGLASEGFVLAVSHSGSTGSGQAIENALDVAYKLSEDGSVAFFEKLSPKAGVTGQSQGGLGTSAAANHERVVAAAPMGGAGRSASKNPMLFITSTGDFMRSSVNTAFRGAQGAAIYVEAQGVSHPGIPRSAGIIKLTGTFFRCHLASDSAACKALAGDCSACSRSVFTTVESK